jgi:hypothetical protein
VGGGAVMNPLPDIKLPRGVSRGVYVIGTRNSKGLYEPPCKIGISREPWERLNTLEAESQLGGKQLALNILYYLELNEEGARKLEKMLHNTFADKCITGEWFNVSPHDATIALCTLVTVVLSEGGVPGSKIFDSMRRAGVFDQMRKTFGIIDCARLENWPISSVFEGATWWDIYAAKLKELSGVQQ